MTLEQAKARIAELEKEQAVMVRAINELREVLQGVSVMASAARRTPIIDLSSANIERTTS